MQSIKEIINGEKWYNDIICRELNEDLKFYSDLRFRHQASEIEELCIKICKVIKEEIKWHTKAWLDIVENIEQINETKLKEQAGVWLEKHNNTE